MPTTVLPAGPRADRRPPSSRSIGVRRVSFDHGSLLDRHFADDDLLLSHVSAVMSAAIPAGEDLVIEAVRRHRRDLDPDLRRATNALIGQEELHSREHDAFNEALHRLGYPVPAIARASRAVKAIGLRLPERLQLAMVAAIEHFTATLAANALGTDHMRVTWGDTSAHDFITWHLFEELEHRSIAFDVMRSFGVSEKDRHRGMRLTLGLFGPVIIGGLVLSLATDAAAWNPVRLARSIRRFRRSPFARTTGSFSDWYRPDFHPEERDVAETMERWRLRLLGDPVPAGSATMG